ncbi:hypothetical protein [Massilia pseudoviolaceinigra]|uniref:hypothetical protein n=1 Tax=Massilia pseudoviolaceinigra TaxID=3057165 RepID=UPI002796B61C|nr:hypothetical protein [Massilia sp. CCM 9206]MDQ1923080.1 hypothetical protein [Massilia sp. CCM 9206]
MIRQAVAGYSRQDAGAARLAFSSITPAWIHEKTTVILVIVLAGPAQGQLSGRAWADTGEVARDRQDHQAALDASRQAADSGYASMLMDYQYAASAARIGRAVMQSRKVRAIFLPRWWRTAISTQLSIAMATPMKRS